MKKMKTKIETGVRWLLAVMMLVFGANKFLSFLPMPAPPEEGAAFLGALAEAGYVFPLLGVLYLLCGALLMVNRAAGLALVLLAPLAVNAALYHVRYDPAGGAGAFVFGGLVLATALLEPRRYASLFK